MQRTAHAEVFEEFLQGLNCCNHVGEAAVFMPSACNAHTSGQRIARSRSASINSHLPVRPRETKPLYEHAYRTGRRAHGCYRDMVFVMVPKSLIQIYRQFINDLARPLIIEWE